MDKFQELYEEMQLSVMNVLDNIILLANSEKRTPGENLKLISQYAKEQTSIICSDLAIHNDNDKIIELALSDKRN